MRHPIARYILTCLLAILLLVGAFIVFVATFDWNRARPLINREVSSRIGRDFAIQGDLKIRFLQGLASEHGWRRYLPRPQISAGDVRLANPGWSSAGPQMFTARHVDLALHPLALLRKRVVLTDVVLDMPVMALERRADGSNSWTFKHTDTSAPTLWSLQVQRLAFAGGSLRYVDGAIDLDLQARLS